MDRAIKSWLEEQQQIAFLPTDPKALHDLATKLSPSYTIFGHMLLLPPKAFSTPSWQDLLTSTNPPIDLTTLYPHITRHLKTTHIALNHPIPPQTTSTTKPGPSPKDPLTDHPNTRRSPLNFTPVHGDFGPSTSPLPPSQKDFNAAFWTSTKQSGLTQTWAPRWTMFSRGNFNEKARLLHLPSVRDAVAFGREEGRGCAAVDLYVGIGYFAFSYLRAGVQMVLGWEINPWSVEGLKRGTEANRWTWVEGTREGFENGAQVLLQGKRVVVFPESNEFAAERIERLRASIPPVRHVNCGLLPTSQGSWETAVAVLDPVLGGWVHIHENFAVGEIEIKAEEVLRWFGQSLGHREVTLEFVHRLKSYAPGVMHCVLDIYIAPFMPG